MAWTSTGCNWCIGTRSCQPSASGHSAWYALDDPVKVRRTEQGQHRQIGFAISAMHCRVDQPGYVADCPQHVARPQITVNQCRILGWAAKSCDAVDDTLDVSRVLIADGALRSRPAQRRPEPALGPHLLP